ncbi:hypothetical protein N0V83_003989 [Neocucurbitaria cava]|uniref:Uncharacterized protein n=1 Tax=Neocucurbitaria cava TaxID=798079 RepID=A0A9W8YAH9_9PLEO|nr:hypothetical protein N0V83_003989 [Neocucurbitaria cava]
MKLLLFLPVLALGTLASNANFANHEIKALLGRAIDPKTMDATQLSVLSVLRTAMPTGVDTPLPTGDFEPEWYQKLPADVKSLLPSLYPEAAAATVDTTTTTTTTRTTTVTTRRPTSAQGEVTAQDVLPTATAAANATTAPWATGSGTGSANGTLSIAAPLPSEFFGTGTKTGVKMEVLTAVMWVGVGMGFCIFA